ncbi:enoyl-CoA hydratase/isomerase family protein [Pseudonocardia sp. CA-107938]|uniref:enoyl-CoA hydratase/isomerase family protein n=1 Tax=Pseudonocardia sp. CA-107938 TaxID=3240021 RepID=UPI003D8DB074
MGVVRFEHADALGVLVVDNPPLNLMSADVIAGFEDAVGAIEAAPIRALLIRTAGPHFMAGADVRVFHERSAADARALFSRALPVFARLEDLPVPTVVAVQGLCLAAGLEVVLCADIVVAGESARFAQVERHIGTTTLLGGIHRLAERAGSARAKQIVFDGDQYTAQQFADWNIVNHVVPDDQVLDRATELARRYAGGPTRALAAGKALIRRYLDNGVRDADRGVLDNGAPLFETRDMQAGVAKVLSGGSRNIHTNTDFEGR